MATAIQMPALSPTMTEGKITRWLKKEGDKVSSGEAIAEVETDKSNLEIESYDDGVLLQVAVKEGEVAKVGAPIAFVGQKGEQVGVAAPAPAVKPAVSAAPKTTAPEAPVVTVAKPVQMPSLSPTMKEGRLLRWLKKEGDKVSSGEPIAEVETDKSNLEIESYDDGILVKLGAKEGELVPVGAPIAYIGEKGAAVSSPGTVAAPPVSAAPVRPSSPGVELSIAQVVPLRRKGVVPEGRVRISPLAKKMAAAQGVDVTQLHGSGPQGRIIKRDVEAALKRPAVTLPQAMPAGVGRPVVSRAEPEALALTGMRKVIAQRMSEVKPGVPHFYLTVDIEMDAGLRIREEAKALDSKVSVNDIIVKAAALALRKVPQVNVQLQGDKLVKLSTADVGVAVALEDGLITPVVRDADMKGLAAISTEVRELAEKARKRALRPEQYAGGSITVSNLGMFGIDSFVAVINPPQSAILAVGQVVEKPVVRDGQVTVRKMMSVTLSGDHRVIDGAVGAQYLKEFRGLLEHPLRLLF